jgi:protein O-GlcNAc transferase
VQSVDKNKLCSCGSGRNYDKCCKFFDQANSLKAKGRYAAAVTNYAQAIKLKPDSAIIYNNLGEALELSGHLDEAIINYRKALFYSSDCAEANLNLGSVCEKKGEYLESVECYERAILLNPLYMEDFLDKITGAYFKLAVFYHNQGLASEAVSLYKKVISHKSDFADAHFYLALVLTGLQEHLEAIFHYRLAIKARSDNLDAYLYLGEDLQKLFMIDDVIDCYDKAFSIYPDHVELLFKKLSSRALVNIPSIHQMDQLRLEIRNDLDDILSKDASVCSLEKLQFHLFNLAYHGYDDRRIMEAVANAVKIKAKGLASVCIKESRSVNDDGRIRIGFISNYFNDHTIGKLTRGYIRDLDRNRFHVTVIHAPAYVNDEFHKKINDSADRVLILPYGFLDAQEKIKKLSLDVLHYPDIGMSPYTYMLAFARLAPVQTVAWGHPLTTGLDSIDYYLSFSATEPVDAEDHYTETLVKLNRAPYFEPDVVPTDTPHRVDLGLPDSGVLYGCMQSLFKIHPVFDAVLAEIIRLDPTGWIILFEGQSTDWSSQLRQRWAESFPDLNERVIFIPRQSFSTYLRLIAHFDIFLDTTPFGSGMTFYQSLAYGIPTVTCPGKFMRGRFVAGIYRWLGIQDAPIVTDINDYAACAVNYAVDSVRRDFFRQQVQEKISMLYNDELALREYETFFEQAVKKAAENEKLINWDSGFLWPSAS